MSTTTFQIGQEVTFANAFGVNVITGIKGNSATTFEKNTGRTFTKRLASLKAYAPQVAYWSEQELATPVHNHGDIVFSSLSVDGRGSKMVWDAKKQDCVESVNI